MTWGEFKEKVEAAGVGDSDEVYVSYEDRVRTIFDMLPETINEVLEGLLRARRVPEGGAPQERRLRNPHLGHPG
jgi:hypothetical protein